MLLEDLVDVASQIASAHAGSLKESTFFVGLQFDVDGHGRHSVHRSSPLGHLIAGGRAFVLE